MKNSTVTFRLNSIKFKNGSPTINYTSNVLEIEGEEGTETYLDTIIHKSTLPPTDEFKESISDLSGVLFKAMGFSLSKALQTIDGLKEKQEDRLNKLNSQLEDKFVATGISLSGEDEKRTATITGYVLDANDCKIGISTAPILLSEQYYEIEDALEDMIDTIESECKSFIFDKKSAQLSLV